MMMIFTLVERVVSTPVAQKLGGSLGEGRWMAHGLCQQMDPEMFFTSDRVGMRDNGTKVKDAKAVCALCPVRTLCLEYAIRTPERLDGIWGGTTRMERRPLRKQFRLGEPEVA